MQLFFKENLNYVIEKNEENISSKLKDFLKNNFRGTLGYFYPPTVLNRIVSESRHKRTSIIEGTGK